MQKESEPKRRKFSTGSVRDTVVGKGRYDLLPPEAIRRIALRFEAGSATYGDRNWEKGQPLSVYLDSGIRHAFNALEGRTDEDHIAAACWNLMAYMQTQKWIADGVLPAELGDHPVAR